MATIVRSQQELDRALADGVEAAVIITVELSRDEATSLRVFSLAEKASRYQHASLHRALVKVADELYGAMQPEKVVGGVYLCRSTSNPCGSPALLRWQGGSLNAWHSGDFMFDADEFVAVDGPWLKSEARS